MEMTITEALSKVKILEDRYLKSLRSSKLVAVKHGPQLRRPYTSYKVEDFEKQAKEQYQSSESLLQNLIKIKNAIAKSNAVTMITIGGKEMTVQEAIILKQFSDLRKKRLSTYKSLLVEATSDLSEALDENNRLIEKLVTGSDKSSEEIRKSTEEILSSSKAVSLVDPCKLQDKIEDWETELSDFENNIDFVLSESNAKTRITIDD